MCVYVCMHAHSTRNDVCSPVCVWCRACVLITFAAPFWRPSHTLPCHDVQLHSHTYRVKKARFLRTSPPALSAQLPPSFVVYHLLPHCWLRRCSVVIGGYYQSERKQKTSTWPIEASTANNSKSQPADLSEWRLYLLPSFNFPKKKVHEGQFIHKFELNNKTATSLLPLICLNSFWDIKIVEMTRGNVHRLKIIYYSFI